MKPILVSIIVASGIGVSVAAASPVVRTIAGTRLTITIGDDTSFQVRDDTVAGAVAVFNPACDDPAQTADAGTLVVIGGVVFGPDFANHTCGSFASLTVVPWTPVSISPVTGSGSSADPFAVVVVVDAGSTGLRLTETITHVNGTGQFHPTFAFANAGPNALTWSTFLATDMNLGYYGVWPILHFGAPAGWAAEKLGAPSPACAPVNYYALLPRADGYTGQEPHVMWNEIASGHLSSTMQSGCSFNGIATEWADRNAAAGQAVTIQPGPVSFVNNSPFASAAVPATSGLGLLLTALGVGLVGYLLARR